MSKPTKAVFLTDNPTKLSIAYNAGIAPVLAEGNADFKEEYAKLIANYEKTGKLPRRLKVAGIVIDSGMNINRWMIPQEDLELVAKQLVGAQMRKDHSEKADDVIGIVKEAWVEGDKVFYIGEIADENIIQKILLGYLKYDSIAVLAQNAFCAHCMNEGKSEEYSRVASLDTPHTCGYLELLIRGAKVVELSIVSMPAYAIAQFVPIGFKASVDLALQKRFENKLPEPVLTGNGVFIYDEKNNNKHVSTSESSSTGSGLGGRKDNGFPIKANLEMSAAPQAELQSPKLVEYDSVMKAFESALAPLSKWAEASYKVMLEEAEHRKKKEEEEEAKKKEVSAKLEELKRVHAAEESAKAEAAAKFKAASEATVASEEVKRKVEEMKSKIAEVRAKVEEARKSREALTPKMEASTVGKAQVGETKEEKSPVAIGTPDGTLPNYWNEILGASGRFKQMGLLTSS
jgi:hypothetical protein